MCPVCLTLGPLTIYWYGVMAAVGFLLACVILQKLHRYAGVTADQMSNFALIAIISGILGARLFYVVQYFEDYEDDLWQIIRVDKGGLVFYGGFLMSMFCIFCYSKIIRADFIRVLDVFTPALAIAHCCGRIGCFTKGCCYGIVAKNFPGVFYPEGSGVPGVEPRHATQLYEAGENILIFFLVLYLARRKPRGVAISVYMIVYGVLRFANEFLRGDNPQIVGLTPAQWIGLGLVPAGAIMLYCFTRKGARLEK